MFSRTGLNWLHTLCNAEKYRQQIGLRPKLYLTFEHEEIVTKERRSKKTKTYSWNLFYRVNRKVWIFKRIFKWPSIDRVVCPIHNCVLKSFVWLSMNYISMCLFWEIVVSLQIRSACFWLQKPWTFCLHLTLFKPEKWLYLPHFYQIKVNQTCPFLNRMPLQITTIVP